MGRYLQFENSDGFLVNDPNDYNATRDAVNQAMRSNIRLSGYDGSPPLLTAHAVGAVDVGQREVLQPNKGVGHQDPTHRSPERGAKHHAAAFSMP